MIISASRRTDIPAFYSEWFINRLKEGYVFVPNPYDPNRLGRVELTPENVDCIVFWTKNPAAMFDRFRQLDSMGYPYYVHFTLTPYGKDIETTLPPKSKLLQTFMEMSERIGRVRSIWRYDPVIIDDDHTVEWHLEHFAKMCKTLRNSTERCFISFIDPYKGLDRRFMALTHSEAATVASGFSDIAETYGITVFTCAENIDLSEHGIEHGACIDHGLTEKVIGYRITAKKDANQRDACRCIEAVDIGAYGTCSHGCSYCYAVTDRATVLRRMAAHDPDSPVLFGHPRGMEKITDRTRPSHRNNQRTLLQWE
jgi:hypothetical protein